MNIDEIIKISFSAAAAVITSVGGASIIIIGLSTWLGKVWAEKIYLKNSSSYNKELERLKKQYAFELEQLKAEITQRRDLLSTSLNALSSGYTSSRERTLVAIETLWKKTLEIREVVSRFTVFYSILLPSEYSDVVSDENNKLLPKISPSDFDAKVLQINKGVDELRPFCGESLYLLFFIYRAFAYRQSFKILRRKNKNIVYEWDKDFDGKEDTAVYQTLKSIFTKEELMSIIDTSQPFAPVQGILNAIELKMLAEMNEWIFGKQLVKISIEEQQRISKLLDPPA